MEYEISVSWEKTVQGYSNENGADGKHRVIDYWCQKTHVKGFPLAKEIIDAIEEGNRYGINIASLNYWKDEPGRFSTNRIEDGDGTEDENGTYLADYDISVTVYKTEQVSLIDRTLGLQSIDG